MDFETVGRAPAEARLAGCKLEDYPCAAPDMVQAVAIQEAMASAMARPVVGWKVGLTSTRAQALCGVDAPLAGPVFEGYVAPSGAEWPLFGGDLGVIEAEIGFRMKADLPPLGRPYTRSEVLDAVGEVLPVFEWVNKRLPGGLMEKPEWLLADGVINRGLICGAGQGLERDVDMRVETVRVCVDHVEVTRGEGRNALGDPAAVLVWLAGDLNARGIGLRAGDLVATGLICDVVQAVPGALIEAHFATLGTVSLRVAPA